MIGFNVKISGLLILFAINIWAAGYYADNNLPHTSEAHFMIGFAAAIVAFICLLLKITK